MKLPRALLVVFFLLAFLLPGPSLAQGDQTPPSVVAIWPPDDPLTEVSWYDADTPLYPSATFSEPMDPAVLTVETFRVTAEGSLLPEAGQVFYSAAERKVWFEPRNSLTPPNRLYGGTVYTVTLSGAVTDLAGNPLGADRVWRFNTHPEWRGHTSLADFSQGTLGAGCYLANSTNGEVILRPALGQEFEGTALPAGWSTAAWGGAGGWWELHASRVQLDGRRLSYSSSFPRAGQPAPDDRRSLDALAIFAASGGAGQEQAVGLASAPDFGGGGTIGGEYAVLSAYNGPQGWGVYARTRAGTNEQVTHLAGLTPGGPLRFRIHWLAGRVEYYHDDQLGLVTLVAAHDLSPAGPLYLAAGDNQPGGARLSVGWFRLSPYAESCVYTSTVITADRLADWGALYWMQQLYGPVSFETRRGHTPAPDASWTAWMPSPNDAPLGDPHTMHLQYRATLAAADPLRSPAFENMWVTYRAVRFSVPLEAGWNLVSLPYRPVESDLHRALARLDGKYSLIYAWDSARQAWLKFDPAAPFGNSLSALEPARGFWIHMREAYPLDISGALAAATSIPLRAGWNLAGYPSQHGHLLPAALEDHGAGTAYTRVLSAQPGSLERFWMYERGAPAGQQSLKALRSGAGYWILTGADAAWSVPYAAAPESLPADLSPADPGAPRPPALPVSLYGLVGLSSASPGDLITAWIGGQQVGQAALTAWQGRLVYGLEIEPGLFFGEIRFQVDGVWAIESDRAWVRGTSRRLDLTWQQVYLPVVFRRR